MVSLDFSIVVFVFIGNIALGLFTLYKSFKSDTNRIFFFFTISLALYNLFNYYALHQTNDLLTFLWIKIVITIAAVINILFFLLVYAFPLRKIHINVVFLLTSLLFTILIIVLTANNIIFTNIAPLSTQPIPGPGILLFVLHTLFFLGGGFVLLISKIRHANGIIKTQLWLLLLGTIVMFILISITNVFFVIALHTTALVGLLPLYTLIFVGFVAYAIVRHKLLDISLLLTRSIAYLALLLMLGAFYTFYLIFIGSLIFQIPFSTKEFIIYGTIMAIVAFTFQPLRRMLEGITDRIFYKGYYDAEKLLKSLSDIMAVTIDLQVLTKNILDKMLYEMRITKGIFVLLKKDYSKEIEYVEGVGYEPLPKFTPEDVLLFLEYKKMIVFEDLEEGAMKNRMRDLKISIIAPFSVHDENIGMLCLGEKASGEIYSQQDLNVIGILAPQLSVAIQNAHEYDEIKRFNVTLREEVDKATKDLKDANERLKDLDKMKDEFVSLASHELRTPMTSISSYTWLLLEQKFGPVNDKQKVYLQNTLTSITRLSNLVNDMLNVSRIEAGRITINPQPLNMDLLTQAVLMEVQPKAQEQGLNLIVDKPATPLPNVLADQDKIKEVMINLIGNSMKFTPSGGKITISFSEKDGFVETHITDTGKGIKSEDVPKLFKKFGMIEGNYLKTVVGQGTGLGLYICKSLIELHGGTIWFHSDGENMGSTFSFSLKKA